MVMRLASTQEMHEREVESIREMQTAMEKDVILQLQSFPIKGKPKQSALVAAILIANQVRATRLHHAIPHNRYLRQCRFVQACYRSTYASFSWHTLACCRLLINWFCWHSIEGAIQLRQSQS